LEYQYESILRGTKTKYIINEEGNYDVLEEGERGNDIVLTIDIELQKAVEKIVEEELLYTRVNDKHAKYFDRAFVVISDPNTGEILAMVGKQLVDEDGSYKIYDFSSGVINASITPGSSVKAASHMVGYVTGNLKIGEVRNDACIKIAATPLKCSYTQYGNISDVQALSYSSNTYQFQTAIKVGNGHYTYDKPLILDENAFDTYRNIFAQFGLGVKTGIDLPNENLGYKGSGNAAGLLLDFSIGQYDNYTPIQMSQYINTVANNGYRMKPTLLKRVYAPDKEGLTNLIYSTSPQVLNKVVAKNEYFSRIKEGLKMVFASGTGYGFIDNKYKPAGKTGTSESFVDTNGDGKIDTETLSTSLVAYAPYNNPTVTFTIITPNVGTGDITFGQMSKVNKRLSQKISKKYFEIYK
jgi:cell division protein FtsI/penicillin-binding protein 2